MILKFIHEYNEWKKTHRQEVQEAKLRKEAMRTPLNYNILDQMFQIWVKNTDTSAVMEIQGYDFTVRCYYDNNGQYRRETRTERIINS